MNTIMANSMKSTYNDLVNMGRNFKRMWDKFAKEECESRSEICICNHTSNEHWLSVIEGPLTCKPEVCPFMDGRE